MGDHVGVLWFPLALGAALFFAAQNGMGKAFLLKTTPYRLALSSHAAAAVFMGAVFAIRLLVRGAPPAAGPGFWPAILVTSVMNAAATLLILSGIRSSPLSLSIPYLSLTPVFILLTGRLLIRESVGAADALAILAVACGSWLLQSRPGDGPWRPLATVLTRKGSRNLLAVALIFSVSAVVDKMALVRSDVVTFLTAAFALRAAILASAAPFLGPRDLPPVSGGTGGAGPVMGLALVLEGLTHMAAINLGPVAYVVAVKRTSVLFSAALGFTVFGEPRGLRTMGGVTLMAAGAAALALLAG